MSPLLNIQKPQSRVRLSGVGLPGIAAQPVKAVPITSRRYLGSKGTLLGFIRRAAIEECRCVDTFADIFAGTGAVASAFADKTLITNDILYSNYICHVAWFGAERYNAEKIAALIAYYNSAEPLEENYMERTFADTFFSARDCRKIGFVREDIERRFNSGEITERERALLVASLLYAMDKIANTCGHYDAYIRGAPFGKHIELCMPAASNDNSEGNLCFNEDANKLVERIEADVVYIDPPYNSRQYCDSYHLLENVARWEKPQVFGVALKMDRSGLKSKYCTAAAAAAFEDLVSKIRARYIILSYNNMARKGNERSNAKISDEEIMAALSRKGRVKVFAQKHKAFTAGKSDIKDNEERLFLCECY